MNGELPGKVRQADPADLANRLTELGFIKLFQGSDEAVLDDIWNTPGAPDALETIALSANAPQLPRFLAAEILFYRNEVRRIHKEDLAPVYAVALGENFTESANAWALPGVMDGAAGDHLLVIGEPMVPELLKMFDSAKRVYYEGSQEATLGHHFAYRVKDLAAYFVSRIRNLPLELDEDPAKRDSAIMNLKRAVK